MGVHMGLRQKCQLPAATGIGVGISPSHSLYCNGRGSTLGLESPGPGNCPKTETRQKIEEQILHFDPSPKTSKSRTASVMVVERDHADTHVQKLSSFSDNCHPVVEI